MASSFEDFWCMGSPLLFPNGYLSTCVHRAIVNGLVPLTFFIISFSCILKCFLSNPSKRRNSQDIYNHCLHQQRPQSIVEAEDLAINKKVQSFQQFYNDSLLSSNQYRKNIIVCVCIFILMSLIIFKASFLIAHNESLVSNGLIWTLTFAIVYIYTFLLAFGRFRLSRHSSPKASYSLIDTILTISNISLFPSISFLDLVLSLSIQQESRSKSIQFFIDLGIFLLSVASCFLELFTKRSSSRKPSTTPLSDCHTSSTSTFEHIQPSSKLKELIESKFRNPQALDSGVSIFSKLWLTYVDVFMTKFWNRQPQEEDIPDLNSNDYTATILKRFRYETKFLQNKHLLEKIFWFLRHEICLHFLLSVTESILTAIYPLVLKLLLDVLSNKKDNYNNNNLPSNHVSILVICLLPTIQILKTLLNTHASLTSTRKIGLRTETVLLAEIFSKTLRLPKYDDYDGSDDNNGQQGPQKEQNSSSLSGGKITSMFSNDIQDFIRLCTMLNNIIITLTTLLIATVILFHVIGIAGLAGLSMMLLVFTNTYILGSRLITYQRRLRNARDERINLISEGIQAIKCLKLFAWESQFLKTIDNARNRELKECQKIWVLYAINSFPFGTLIAASTFAIHVLVLNRPLNASTAFTSLSLFYLIRGKMSALGNTSSKLFDSLVAAQRINNFLTKQETKKYNILSSLVVNEDQDDQNSTIGFNQAKFVWSSDTSNFSLNTGTISFPRNGLSLVIGTLGSGKSSLLLALLGEMTLVSGQAILPCQPSRRFLQNFNKSKAPNDSVAYCSQTPWLLSTTIRKNIIFGQEFDSDRYAEVIYACALEPDLAALKFGDNTEVGEKGINLSGGQKARVCLARALYSWASIILLDDVLSAVDNDTAIHLNEYYFNGPLMKGRTCILVTHFFTLCAPRSKFIVYLKNGSVAHSGPPENFKSFQKSFKNREVCLQTQEMSNSPVNDYDNQHNSNIVNDEYRQQGRVSFEVYKLYLNSFGGWKIWTMLISFFILSQAVEVRLQFWLKLWASSYENDSSNQANFLELLQIKLEGDNLERTIYYFKIYVLLTILLFFTVGARMICFLFFSVRASRFLHHNLIRNIFGAKMKFFEKTPAGRIINRTSQDMGIVDSSLGPTIMLVIADITWVLGIVIAISLVVPKVLLVGSGVLILYLIIAMFFLGSSREVKRLKSVSKSPIFGLMKEAMNGRITIRAYGDNDDFLDKMTGLIDIYNRSSAMLIYSVHWLSIRVNTANAVFIFGTAIAVLLKSQDAATAGFVLTYALTLQQRLLNIVKRYSDLEISINSVERIHDYFKLAKEEIKGEVPPAYWPSRNGVLEIENLYVRYDPQLPFVLNNISFKVQPKEKVAIVGRTGSGKSSLISAIMRLVEAEHGQILLDGLDLSKVKLKDLRSRLLILPQETVLFKGSLRYNLDPFSEYEDIVLWSNIRKVGLVKELSNGSHEISSLDTKIEEGGKNLSSGEQQLIVLARGLLRLQNTSIVIMDESTSSLDPKSELQFRKVIKEEMEDVTVLCVAHRLQSIIGFDKVLVFENGQIIESGTPVNLLEDRNSVFRRLCHHSGNLNTLESQARSASSNRIDKT